MIQRSRCIIVIIIVAVETFLPSFFLVRTDGEPEDNDFKTLESQCGGQGTYPFVYFMRTRKTSNVEERYEGIALRFLKLLLPEGQWSVWCGS